MYSFVNEQEIKECFDFLFDRLSICCNVTRFQIMMSCAFLHGSISLVICQCPLFLVQFPISHLPLPPGCEAHVDSGVRPELCLSCDAESFGEK